MRIAKLFYVCLCISPAIFAQNDIPVGTWRTHLSYNNVIDIALADTKVYAATKNAIFVLDKEDGSIQTITKLDGLTGGEISAMAFAKSVSTLIIGYQDGNIDLIKGNVISTISTIKNDNFTNDKRINNIYVLNNLAYLAANFGVSIIDLDKSIIKETAVGLGPDRIHDVTILEDSLYAASSNGIISVSLDASVNFLDFNNWVLFEPQNQSVISIINSNNQLYAAEATGNLYRYDIDHWTELPILAGESFSDLTVSNSGIFIATDDDLWEYKSSTLASVEIQGIQPNKIQQEQNGTIWIADQNQGLIKAISPDITESIIPSGPTSDNSFQASFIENQLIVVSGGISEDDIRLERNDGFYSFTAGLWKNYNSNRTGIAIPDVSDLTDITYNPVTQQFVLSSFGDGLLIVNEDNSTEIINEASSGSTLFDGVISNVAYGNEGLWILNYGQSNAVHHWSDDNNWENFTLNNTATRYPLEIIIAQNNDKWLRLSPEKGGGLFVFNEDSGKQRLLNNNTNNGNLPTNDVYDIVEDQDGLIWVGTGRGVVYFNGSASIEDNNTVNAITPLVGFIPLLRDEKVLSIAIDSGNRKWIGTENGVWLFDEGGETEIYHFNVNNSPLPSNNVISMAINNISGEILFCTDLGMVSFRGTATEAGESHQSIKVFPNPITRDFTGLVSISGLVRNATVKITDLSGKLITQMKSNGGTAIWNIKDYQGNRASTGVYLVFSSNEDGTDALVGKLAVVN